jgi:heme exporter protein CcmD
MSDFLGEGGFAAYVWPAYLISAFALAALTGWTVASYRKAKAALERLENGGPK